MHTCDAVASAMAAVPAGPARPPPAATAAAVHTAAMVAPPGAPLAADETRTAGAATASHLSTAQHKDLKRVQDLVLPRLEAFVNAALRRLRASGATLRTLLEARHADSDVVRRAKEQLHKVPQVADALRAESELMVPWASFVAPILLDGSDVRVIRGELRRHVFIVGVPRVTAHALLESLAVDPTSNSGNTLLWLAGVLASELAQGLSNDVEKAGSGVDNPHADSTADDPLPMRSTAWDFRVLADGAPDHVPGHDPNAMPANGSSADIDASDGKGTEAPPLPAPTDSSTAVGEAPSADEWGLEDAWGPPAPPKEQTEEELEAIRSLELRAAKKAAAMPSEGTVIAVWYTSRPAFIETRPSLLHELDDTDEVKVPGVAPDDAHCLLPNIKALFLALWWCRRPLQRFLGVDDGSGGLSAEDGTGKGALQAFYEQCVGGGHGDAATAVGTVRCADGKTAPSPNDDEASATHVINNIWKLGKGKPISEGLEFDWGEVSEEARRVRIPSRDADCVVCAYDASRQRVRVRRTHGPDIEELEESLDNVEAVSPDKTSTTGAFSTTRIEWVEYLVQHGEQLDSTSSCLWPPRRRDNAVTGLRIRQINGNNERRHRHEYDYTVRNWFDCAQLFQSNRIYAHVQHDVWAWDMSALAAPLAGIKHVADKLDLRKVEAGRQERILRACNGRALAAIDIVLYVRSDIRNKCMHFERVDDAARRLGIDYVVALMEMVNASDDEVNKVKRLGSDDFEAVLSEKSPLKDVLDAIEQFRAEVRLSETAAHESLLRAVKLELKLIKAASYPRFAAIDAAIERQATTHAATLTVIKEFASEHASHARKMDELYTGFVSGAFASEVAAKIRSVIEREAVARAASSDALRLSVDRMRLLSSPVRARGPLPCAVPGCSCDGREGVPRLSAVGHEEWEGDVTEPKPCPACSTCGSDDGECAHVLCRHSANVHVAHGSIPGSSPGPAPPVRGSASAPGSLLTILRSCEPPVAGDSVATLDARGTAASASSVSSRADDTHKLVMQCRDSSLRESTVKEVLVDPAKWLKLRDPMQAVHAAFRCFLVELLGRSMSLLFGHLLWVRGKWRIPKGSPPAAVLAQASVPAGELAKWTGDDFKNAVSLLFHDCIAPFTSDATLTRPANLRLRQQRLQQALADPEGNNVLERTSDKMRLVGSAVVCFCADALVRVGVSDIRRAVLDLVNEWLPDFVTCIVEGRTSHDAPPPLRFRITTSKQGRLRADVVEEALDAFAKAITRYVLPGVVAAHRKQGKLAIVRGWFAAEWEIKIDVARDHGLMPLSADIVRVLRNSVQDTLGHTVRVTHQRTGSIVLTVVGFPRDLVRCLALIDATGRDGPTLCGLPVVDTVEQFSRKCRRLYAWTCGGSLSAVRCGVCH